MITTTPTDNKTPKGRIKCDSRHESENILFAILLRFDALLANAPQTLQTIADKALPIQAIEFDLLTAEEKV